MATANGTVHYEVDGQAMTLRLSTNALCALEDQTKLTPIEIASELQFGISNATLRALFWSGSGDPKMTLGAAGDLIDRIGKRHAVKLAKEAWEAAHPAPDEIEDAEGKEKAENPPNAATAG